MNRIVPALTLCSLLALLPVADASAQGRRSGGGSSAASAPRFEITPFGGYVWTDSQEVYDGYGTTQVDIEDSGFWGVALDVNVPAGTSQVELLYQRQDTELTAGSSGFQQTKVADVAVEYYQIGGLSGTRRGNVYGFGGLTVGATRLIYDAGSVDGDNWKFSMIFSLGAKAYLNDRVGLRVQGRVPFTVISAGGTVGCGSAGCYSTVSGEGIGQVDLSAGLIILM
jgi:hypothetical protein